MTRKYEDLSKDEKVALFNQEHLKNNKSLNQLAQEYSTYPNKLRRDAIALGVAIRNKSDAQKVALSTGKAKHPTKGTKRPEDTKIKISDGRAEAWKNMSQEDKDRLSDLAKKQWADMSVEDRKVFHHKAGEAIRKAAKEGSKLEKHILQVLVAAGYRVDFHKEHLLLNERLQLDLFLPKLDVAIEIDGPSHFLPIWGDKTLQRNKKSDYTKNGLLLSKGIIVIRIKQDSHLSDKFKRDVANSLLKTLEEISTNKPPLGKRYIEL